jgi:hypothetical protein
LIASKGREKFNCDLGNGRALLLPAQRVTISNCHLRLRGAPGAQFLSLGFFGMFEVIVGLHEEKPGTLPVVDRMSLLQASFSLPPPQIDASH